jgi:type II secretory pathway pseudopilin PulG
VGGSLTSTVAWRVLSDTKQARKRTEEKEAAATITSALLEVRQIYRNSDVVSGPAPEDFDTWSDYLLS